jgi:hypothetical protein
VLLGTFSLTLNFLHASARSTKANNDWPRRPQTAQRGKLEIAMMRTSNPGCVVVRRAECSNTPFRRYAAKIERHHG